jgi:oligoribonuclease NrnB/cAMP/cGMP phosphodiesterase (DHH superfamily)
LKVLYHKNCADGFCAAYMCWLKFKDKAEYIAVQYGEDPPDVTGHDVMVVDFSYKREVLEGMRSVAKSLIVLDHHKTAHAELVGLPYCIFNMDKSGARLTQEYLFGPEDDNFLVDYTEDRDLWRWKLPYSREVSAAIASWPFDFDVWHKFNYNDLRSEGAAILRYQDTVIRKHCESPKKVHIQGHLVPIVNATTVISEIGNVLCQGHPFSASWFYVDGKYVYSLRSAEDGIDVSEIAKVYGGGGHKHAAGFSSKTFVGE